MDTLTHTIVGAAVARATAAKTEREERLPVRIRVLVGGLAAAFPDIDFFTRWIDPLSFISDWHRAETHSFVMLPVWAAMLGLVCAWITGRRHHWREFTFICGLSIFSHILTDLITSWGTQIFAPLSEFRASWGVTFIIDPYFTLIVLVGLIAALLRGSRVPAQAGLAVLVGYIGLQAAMKWQAHSIGEQYRDANGWPQASVYTMPQPFSPFHWKIIISEGERYHMTYLDLAADVRKPAPDTNNASLLHAIYYYRPKEQLIWSKYSRYGNDTAVKAVWNDSALEPYRRFASHPALYRIDNTGTNNCVWFMDLRFTIPQLIPPFRYGMCKLEVDHDRKLYRLKRGQEQEKERIPRWMS